MVKRRERNMKRNWRHEKRGGEEIIWKKIKQEIQRMRENKERDMQRKMMKGRREKRGEGEKRTTQRIGK